MTPLVLLQFMICPLVFMLLLRTTAPYGKHFSPGWGPAIPNRSGWFLMELPAFLVVGYVLVTSDVGLTPVAGVPWLLWSMHYGYRAFIFPCLMRSSGKNFPVLLVVSGAAFNVLNGYNNGQALLTKAAGHEALFSIHFAVGTLLFLAGAWLHIGTDHTIRQLRHTGSEGYKIPAGKWFDRVSNPNYFGEIIQWAGWAILTWSWAGLAFALFTFCNLAPRAIANHRWYRNSFADYPAKRKILIPGLF